MMKRLRLLFGIILSVFLYSCDEDPATPKIPTPIKKSGDNAYLPNSLGEIVEHSHYILSYVEIHEQAEWICYELTKQELNGIGKRTNDFRSDPHVTTGSAELSDYRYSGYDRGHLAPAADFKFSKTAMSESFYLSNISPQKHSFNNGIWLKLEKKVREWTKIIDTLYIVVGSILKFSIDTIGKNEVTVPKYFYKILYDPQEEEAIAFIIPNEKSIKPLNEFVVSIDSIEYLTDIDFFPDLKKLEEKIESKKNTNWPPFKEVLLLRMDLPPTNP